MSHIAVGAIRWDAWGTRDVGPAVRDTLSLQRFHFRLPFYAHIIANDQVFIPPYSQELIDREITLAKEAGLDYWAFCWYQHGNADGGLDSARLLYQKSALKNEIRWCPILCVSGFDVETDGAQLVQEMKEENFMRIDGRPLVYLFHPNQPLTDALREMCQKENVPEPLFYLMGWGNIWENAQAMKADGISCYANGARDGAMYAQLAEAEEKRWADMGAHMNLIPTVTTGWDKRPRYYHPVGWEFMATNNYPRDFTYQGTDSEIAAHLDRAMAYCVDHPDQTPAQSVLIYAWNENDEGGWIVPTLKEYEDYGRPVRLDAVREIIKKYNG